MPRSSWCSRRCWSRGTSSWRLATLYGGSLTQFGLSFKKLGWTCHFVDPLDPENFRRALTPKCKAIFVESLANPGGVIVDMAAIAEIAHSAGIAADRR